jgi:membrane-bound metal-dependent hydrolase YbcI (DUF457 family)
MLGRSHVSLSIATVLPFIIPLMFLENKFLLTYSIAFVICILIGSLLPDSDCGGKPKLYYDFKPIYFMMLPISWIVVKLFKSTHLKHKLNLKYEVNNEHRGIMHSPIGVFISTIFLTLIILVFVLIIQSFNILFILAVFFGLLIGQLLHLLEDSCTVSGINWKFPFGTKNLNGTIMTFEGKEINKKDIRTMYYSYILYAISGLIFIGFAFQKINRNILVLYSIILILVFIAWIIILFLSRTDRNSWLREVEGIRKMKRVERRFTSGKVARDLSKTISGF